MAEPEVGNRLGVGLDDYAVRGGVCGLLLRTVIAYRPSRIVRDHLREHRFE
jgi:hypothetical protein